jgi:hypothetical protein
MLDVDSLGFIATIMSMMIDQWSNKSLQATATALSVLTGI